MMPLLRKIGVIAKNTFREAVRDRVLYNLVLFALLITASAILLGELTYGQEARTIVNLGLAAILFFGAFIAILVGVGLVSKEIEKRTIYAIFAKPVTRGEFIVGKFLGLVLTLAVNVAVMGAGVSLALLYVGGGSFVSAVWPSVFLILLELSVLTAVAILFSSFSTPALSALLTFFVFVIGHFSSSLRELAQGTGSIGAKYFFDAVYYLLPNFSHFSFATNASHGELPPAVMVTASTAYAIVFDIVLVVVAVQIFRRRNFK